MPLPSRRTDAGRSRLALAFLLSLLMHALLLSLNFGGQGQGLPGLAFPWRDRWIEAPELRVVLRPAPVAAAAPALKALPQSRSPGPPVAARPVPGRTVAAIVSRAETTAKAEPAPEVAARPLPAPSPAVAVIALEQSDEPAFVVPPPPLAPVTAVAPDASSTPPVAPAPPEAAEVVETPTEPERPAPAAEAAEADAAARAAPRQAEQLAAAREAAARAEAARLEAEHEEAERLAAARLEAQRQEVARQEAARVEAARVEAERHEAARLAAARLEAQRREAARQEAARAEAARLDTERQEAEQLAAARLEAQRQEVARQDAARAEAARVQAEQEEDARREARRRAMGRQLEEEAARRQAAADAARGSSRLPLSLSTARRVRLWGRADPNVELVRYAEAWARKIQLNTSVDTVREVAKRPHTDPMVTVAMRSDGSVESVTFVLSSGVAEIDEAIRRIVQGLVPYEAFPPALARQYDVVEIRRTWYFDTGIRLY